MKLSTVLKDIGEVNARLDDMAGRILDIVRTSKITTEQQFRDAVVEAYAENGWRATPGRPAEDDGLARAPKTVAHYVFVVRRGFKLRIKVAECKSLYELRQLIEKKRMSQAEQVEEVEMPPALVGLRIVSDKRFTGAHVHDLAVLYSSLPKKQKGELEASIARLINKFMPKAPQELRLVA